MSNTRRGFLGALSALAGAAILAPGTANVVKAGSTYGDQLIEEAYRDGIISLETANSLVSTPLRPLTDEQAGAVDQRVLKKGTKAYLEACYRLMNATEEQKKQTLCLLRYNGQAFEGPLAESFTEQDDPFRMDFVFAHDCQHEFIYDGVQIVLFDGSVLPEAEFRTPPWVNAGDTLIVNWHLSI